MTNLNDFYLQEHSTSYESGSSIIRFPSTQNGHLIYRNLNDQGEEFLFDSFNITRSKNTVTSENVPILGLYQTETSDLSATPGRIVVYGDSNCLDSSHMKIG